MACLQLWPIQPELALGLGALLCVPISAVTFRRWPWLPSIWAGLVLTAALVLALFQLQYPVQTVFCGTYALDPFGAVYKLLLTGSALLGLLFLSAYFRGHDSEAHAPIFLLFATLGGVGLVGSLDLGLIVLFLQMLSGASYLLVGLARGQRRAGEAVMKYFVYGAVALAVLAYGLSFLYGLTGALNLNEIGAALRGADPAWVWVALVLVLVGYAFEVTAVPFHFWAPDVYDGASAPVAGIISVLPKIAGFGGLLRLLTLAFPDGLSHWPLLVAGFAALTMLLGNLAALRQRGFKRLLAYSSVAQAGYILIAVAAASSGAQAQSGGAQGAVAYYLAAYALMNLAAFGAVARLERTRGALNLTHWRGLGRAAPGLSIALALALLSLAGFPPLAGFAGKVLLLNAALGGGLTWLAVFAAANMVLGLAYYVRPLVELYLAPEHVQTEASALHRQPGYAWGLAACTAGTLLLGIVPGPVLALLALARTLAR